jgi:hypothetical protein
VASVVPAARVAISSVMCRPVQSPAAAYGTPAPSCKRQCPQCSFAMPGAVQRRPELRSDHAFAVCEIPEKTLLENGPGQEHSGAAVISSEAGAEHDMSPGAHGVSDRW